MSCSLSEHELYIIHKIIVKNRWCNKHINREGLASGVPKDKVHLYRDAIDSLVRKGYLKSYISQGRTDICVRKEFRFELIEFLKQHRDEYAFLKNIDFSMIH